MSQGPWHKDVRRISNGWHAHSDLFSFFSLRIGQLGQPVMNLKNHTRSPERCCGPRSCQEAAGSMGGAVNHARRSRGSQILESTQPFKAVSSSAEIGMKSRGRRDTLVDQAGS